MRHAELLALGAALGLVAGLAVRPLSPAHRAWALAPLPAVGLLVGPGLAVALDSWERPGVLVVAILVVGLGFVATGGASAAEPLGPAGTAWALAGIAAATILAVPDTEGPLLATGALLGAAVAAALAGRWGAARPTGTPRVAEGPAAVAAALVGLVAVAGATDGVVAAVGALGCAAVPLAAGPLGRRPQRPAVPAWLAAPVLTAAAVLVARLGAVRSSSPRALAVTVVAIAAAWGALEAGARLTSGPAPPRR